MFGHSATRTVRREDLHSPASSPRSSPDPALDDLLRSRAHTEFVFTNAPDNGVEAQDIVSDEDETELRLFATPSDAAPTSHKIRLSSPGATNTNGFIIKKPRSYYFAEDLTTEQKAKLEAAAIDAKTILELSSLPWPGCALPWKVRKISAAGIKKEVLVGHPPTLVTSEEPIPKRTRKNKKTRIAIRKKMQASKERKEKQAQLALVKEEADREKRTRRNREKKVKRKAREKAKKAEGKAEGDVDGAEQKDGQEDDSDSDD